jgi:RNA polymerase sigma-70 factor (ECF subfamily)
VRLSWDLHKLFQSHAAEIMRALRRRGISAETAADITQDTFLRLMTASPANGRAEGNPRAYLHRISQNLVIDYRRRERLMTRVDITDEALERIADPAPSQETVVYDKQRLNATQRAIDELPERTRRAFELYRLDELTISEVAQEIGLSTTRTWMLIRDAYQHIRSRLAEH